MPQESLTTLVHQHLEKAAASSSGRSAHTMHAGPAGPGESGGTGEHREQERVLRQTLIALRAGSSLREHENPGEATLQVLHGRVTLLAGEARWDCPSGDLVTIPDARHSLDAVEDSVVLLTVGRRPA